MSEERKLRLRLRLTNETGIVMGPGRADLLGLIAETGSIAAAGRRMGMSYRRAWSLVEAMNSSFTFPLVETAKGGAERGGARLTTLGHELLAAYSALVAAAESAGHKELARFEAAMLAPPLPG